MEVMVLVGGISSMVVMMVVASALASSRVSRL